MMPESLAQSMDIPNDSLKSIDTVWRFTTKLKLRDLSPPYVSPDDDPPAGVVKLLDLPLQQVHNDDKKLQHMFDVLPAYDGDIDKIVEYLLTL